MQKTPTLIDRVARFFTGRTPGLARENEASCKRSSAKIDESAKNRATASKNFRQAQSELKDSIDENVVLTESVFINAKKA
jgi:hypothetical protein